MILPRRRLLQLGLGAAASLAAAPEAALAHHRHAHEHAAGHGRGHVHAALRGRHGRHGGEAAAQPAALVHPAPHPLGLSDAPRHVKLHNLHTDESVDAVYFDKGAYVPDALHAVNHVLRDFRTGDIHPMDPQLLDLLVALNAKTESRATVQVISGYRSPRTNALLRALGGEETGVARKSLHMQGQAIDLRLADVPLGHVHNAALALGRGGVGYYPISNFVHVDVGPVRRWGGI